MRCWHTALRVQAIRANGRAGTKVGPAENIDGRPARRSRRRHNIRAAELATRELNAPYLTVILEGRYTDEYLKAAGADAPKFTEADLEIDREPGRLRRPQRLRAGRLTCAPRDTAPGYAQLPLPGLLSAHGIAVAGFRARDALLGAAPGRRSCGT